MEGSMCHACNHCGCNHHKIVPTLVLIGGAVYLLGAFGVVSSSTVSVIIPLLVIVGAVMKLVGGTCKCYQKQQ